MPGMNRFPKPSPTDHTPSAQTMEARRAAGAVRLQIRPTPIATCVVAKTVLKATRWPLTSTARSWVTSAIGWGTNISAIPSTLSKNARLNM